MLEVSLEYIADSTAQDTFRVAFHSAAERCLLLYPAVTGLTFTDASGDKAAEWRTRVLATQPLDDFVLNPGDRISFDLHANINAGTQGNQWFIELPPGTYDVHFAYRVERDTDWYDFLAKRSRFVSLTPIWRGSLESNTIRLMVTDDTRRIAK